MSATLSQDERRAIIWSTNAWVGFVRADLSREAAEKVLWTALRDRLPDVTEREVGYALGMVAS